VTGPEVTQMSLGKRLAFPFPQLGADGSADRA
jgi:hypothetical protein